MSPEMRQLLNDTVTVLASPIAVKDPYTAQHSRGVAKIAGTSARELGAASDFIHGIHVMGLFHDLGKIAIPGAILTRPPPGAPGHPNPAGAGQL